MPDDAGLRQSIPSPQGYHFLTRLDKIAIAFSNAEYGRHALDPIVNECLKLWLYRPSPRCFIADQQRRFVLNDGEGLGEFLLAKEGSNGNSECLDYIGKLFAG